jgi:hypothetical protein
MILRFDNYDDKLGWSHFSRIISFTEHEWEFVLEKKNNGVF